MAIYHFSVSIISRNKGRSAVGSAAYRAGEKIYNEYDGITHDYTKKSGIAHTEIILTNNAPKEYFDRSTLWNAVEKFEKSKNARTAREIEVALPAEFTQEEQLEIIRKYVQENFVNRGMCADICLHDKNDGNPHAHIMLTVRPINVDGTWGTKQKKVYELDEKGNKIYDSEKRTYKCKTLKTTDWDKPETLMEWREQWAEICNNLFEDKGLKERIDHRSYEEQGVEKIPTRHLGVFASEHEKKGNETVLGSINREIKKDNEEVVEINKKIVELHGYRQRLEDLKSTIDRCVLSARNFEEFLLLMEEDGYKIKQGKHIAFCKNSNSKFIRAKSLGEDYTEDKIKERIKNKINERIKQYTKSSSESNRPTGKKKINALIDIDNHAKCKASKGYEHWAKINNLKITADTINYLTENDLLEPKKMKARINDLEMRSQRITEAIKAAESSPKTLQEKAKYTPAGTQRNDYEFEPETRGKLYKEQLELQSEIDQLNILKSNFEQIIKVSSDNIEVVPSGFERQKNGKVTQEER